MANASLRIASKSGATTCAVNPKYLPLAVGLAVHRHHWRSHGSVPGRRSDRRVAYFRCHERACWVLAELAAMSLTSILIALHPRTFPLLQLTGLR